MLVTTERAALNLFTILSRIWYEITLVLMYAFEKKMDIITVWYLLRQKVPFSWYRFVSLFQAKKKKKLVSWFIAHVKGIIHGSDTEFLVYVTCGHKCGWSVLSTVYWKEVSSKSYECNAYCSSFESNTCLCVFVALQVRVCVMDNLPPFCHLLLQLHFCCKIFLVIN